LRWLDQPQCWSTYGMIEILLTLSAGHLREETCNGWLHQAPFAAFAKADYDWFVYVADDEPDDLPDDLRACLALARSSIQTG
jgi:hypothetical protein